MSSANRKKAEDLDKELAILRHLIEKENEMLRNMISSLDALEKKMTRSQNKAFRKQKKNK